MDVVDDFMCLSRLCSRHSGCCRIIKDKEDTSEVDKDFAEHCHGNVSGETTCGVCQRQGRISSSGLNEVVDRSGLKKLKECEEEL